jgi:hypothetical protein
MTGRADTFATTMLPRANRLALVTRHSTNALAAIVALADPAARAPLAGELLMAALGAWAFYRLATRSLRAVFTAIDCAFVLAICGAAPVLSASFESVQSSRAIPAVVSATIIGLAVALPLHASIPITCLILATLAWGDGSVAGWDNVATMWSLRHLAIAAAMGVILRVTLLRVADATNRANENYLRAGELRNRIAAAERDYEREQFALLHDHVASTLLLVGDGTPVPQDRLAAQARSALAVLTSQRPAHPPRRVELVAALRASTRNTCTPVRFHGSSQLWLDGEVCMTIEAATGEVLKNVDRHAGATGVSIDVSNHRLAITDDGRGFMPVSTRGHGITESIVGRMNRIGGTATIRSALGQGTTVELSWPTKPRCTSSPTSVTEAHRLVRKLRERYRYALIAWALLVVILSLPFALTPAAHPTAQIGMVVLAVAGCLAALPTSDGRNSALRWIAVTTLLVVAVVQPAILPEDLVGTIAQWSLWATGWCLSPLLLGLPLRVAISLVATNWAGASAATFARAPSTDILVALGFIGASLGVLLVAAQVADRMFAEAAADALAQAEAHLDLLVRQRAAAAAHIDFRCRIADVRQRVEPVMLKLSNGEPVDPVLRKRALVESQRIRTLLDQQASREHPLLDAMRPALDAATHRDVDVTVHVQSGLPTLGEDDVEQLVKDISRILGNCTESLRVVLSCISNEFMVSIVCRGYNGVLNGEHGAPKAGSVEVVSHDDATWFTIRHPVPMTSTDQLLDYDCAS